MFPINSQFLIMKPIVSLLPVKTLRQDLRKREEIVTGEVEALRTRIAGLERHDEKLRET